MRWVWAGGLWGWPGVGLKRVDHGGVRRIGSRVSECMRVVPHPDGGRCGSP